MRTATEDLLSVAAFVILALVNPRNWGISLLNGNNYRKITGFPRVISDMIEALNPKPYVVQASGRVKMVRNAVGERPAPKSGLQAYFEPSRCLKDINFLTGPVRR